MSSCSLTLSATGILFPGIAADNAWMMHDKQRAARRLKEAVVPGEATIERRFLAPYGVTPRLEYRITIPEGKAATRNTEVDREYWDSLEGARTSPVVFVPDEPSISRLEEGRAPERDLADQPLRLRPVCGHGGLWPRLPCRCCFGLAGLGDR
jgi:hypothetical protein